MIGKVRDSKSFHQSRERDSLDIAESRMRNDRQSIFAVVRDLVRAQFELGDQELTNRLWKDIADREIDIDRIINLMYGCSFHDNDREMLQVDLAYQNKLNS